MKKIKFSDSIDLPSPLVYRYIDGHSLFIAPDKPTWIVTNDIGAFMILPLSEGQSIEQAINFTITGLGIEQSQAKFEMKQLLQEVETQQFYQGVQTKKDNDQNKKASIHLTLTRACNLRCIHCYINGGTPFNDELTNKEWKKVIHMLTEIYGQCEFTISGGEPMFRSDFFDIAEYVKSCGHSTLLMTNGTLINSSEIAERLVKVVDRIQISLDGTSPESTDRIRGKGSFNKIVSAIEFLKCVNAKLTLAFVLLPDNIDALANKLVDFVSSLNYPNINIRLDDSLTDLGRAKKLPQSYFDLSITIKKKYVKNILKQLWKKGWAEPPRFYLHRQIKNCGIGHGLAIDSNGDIYPCSLPICNYGNYRTHDLRKIANEINLLNESTSVDKIEKCQNCEVKYICSGGCRIMNKEKNGDFLIPYCENGLKEKVIQRMITLNGR